LEGSISSGFDYLLNIHLILIVRNILPKGKFFIIMFFLSWAAGYPPDRTGREAESPLCPRWCSPSRAVDFLL